MRVQALLAIMSIKSREERPREATSILCLRFLKLLMSLRSLVMVNFAWCTRARACPIWSSMLSLMVWAAVPGAAGGGVPGASAPGGAAGGGVPGAASATLAIAKNLNLPAFYLPSEKTLSLRAQRHTIFLDQIDTYMYICVHIHEGGLPPRRTLNENPPREPEKRDPRNSLGSLGSLCVEGDKRKRKETAPEDGIFWTLKIHI